MYNFNSTTILISLILIIVIGGVGILNITGVKLPYFNWLEKGIYNLISPFIKYFTYTYRKIANFWYGLMTISEIVKENEALKMKVADLERTNNIYQSYKRQNQRLRELLAFKELVEYETEGASVIGYSPINWEEQLIIDKGQDHGLQENMPVIGYNGMLVGQISYVGKSSAQVKLVNNPEFVVGGIVQREESRAIGVVKGQLNDRKFNIMEKISWDADIEKGDIILTSGLSNNYPRYLPIGKVVEVDADNYGLSRKAKIELFFSTETAEEVLVITSF